MKTSNFIGAVLAGSIALTSTFAAPVAASSKTDNLAKILLGAAAIGLVVHTVKKNKKRRAAVARQNQYRPQQYQQRGYHNNHRPKTCLRKKYTYNGWKTFYSKKCLAQHRRQHNDEYVDVRDNYEYHNRRRDRHGNYNNRYDYNSQSANTGYQYKRSNSEK
jgi:hypothetical protein